MVDRPQQHRRRAGRLEVKTYATYRCDLGTGRRPRGSIRIYNLTAVRRQVLSPKVFLETLLHEWVHHYDFAGLGLERSPHTPQFFDRVRAVAEALRVAFVVPPRPGSAAKTGPGDSQPGAPASGPEVVRVMPPDWVRDKIGDLFRRRPASP